MKQNVIMLRTMGNFNVSQRTKDGMFNATKLVKQWNSIGSNPKRDISKFWESSKVNEFITELINQDIIHTPKEGYVKSRASRGVNAGTWMHPYLFIKFAMWLNPKFEVNVIKFVYDELIKNRHNAGDNYLKICSAAKKFKGVDYRFIAKGINYIVFKKHDKGLRQTANEDQLSEMAKIENELSFAIDMDYITSFEQLKNTIRMMYVKKYGCFN